MSRRQDNRNGLRQVENRLIGDVTHCANCAVERLRLKLGQSESDIIDGMIIEQSSSELFGNDTTNRKLPYTRVARDVDYHMSPVHCLQDIPHRIGALNPKPKSKLSHYRCSMA
jgi:hypothetical protein